MKYYIMLYLEEIWNKFHRYGAIFEHLFLNMEDRKSSLIIFINFPSLIKFLYKVLK